MFVFRKLRSYEKKFSKTMDRMAEIEADLLIVTENNKWQIQEKLAEILEQESETKNHIDPGDIYLRVGSVSPFGKEQDGFLEEFETVAKNAERFEEQKNKIEHFQAKPVYIDLGISTPLFCIKKITIGV